jgi:general secretion pathway protein B
MSYILEALKRSQNERELGKVPTLIAVPAKDSNRVPRGKPWGPVAVGLAVVAVGIALYAALTRLEVQPPTPQPEPEVAGVPTGTPVAVTAEPAAYESQTAEVVPIQAPLSPASSPQTLDAQRLSDASIGSGRLVAPPPFASAQQPLTETAIRGDVPPLARDARPPHGAMDSDTLAALEDDAASIEATDLEGNPMEESMSSDWMEMDEEIGPAEPEESPPPVPDHQARPRRTRPARAIPPEPEAAPIPEDLRQDVEAFKEQIRRERSGAAPRPADTKATPTDPTKLRLPLEIETRLPAFFMTAHIYDIDTSKRFVVINALKYTPGDTTREGLKVEDILPDGVVLSFEGHRFYRRR